MPDFEKILFGDEEWGFVPEIMIRTLVMYLIILFSLRLLGKRGVKQLSVFELVVIISLGSAAGDPMFYKEVGLGSALVVFAVVVSAYKFTSYLVGKYHKIEKIVEGTATSLIKDGEFSIENFKKETLAQDEFFAELRQKSVSHLGQVKLAIIETSGELSAFFYEDDAVKYGLPILPDAFNAHSEEIETEGLYSCSFCGNTKKLQPARKTVCTKCSKTEWVKSINEKRIA
ncbi:DUF421 domain-containing protein [Pedobacter sp. Leaf194]|uniref:DUF421 domain-containing protein n=1 Tax=Pedobacter sp. Leaf194 TaxID=1736297 RepID=UPI00070391EF|nr:YetF domain-containing protein [Pedobacter sp. Leaf194]KQS32501.1 hypothetical protein ASG14_16585 [Pedobacter sp. Leaf194]